MQLFSNQIKLNQNKKMFSQAFLRWTIAGKKNIAITLYETLTVFDTVFIFLSSSVLITVNETIEKRVLHLFYTVFVEMIIRHLRHFTLHIHQNWYDTSNDKIGYHRK